MTFNGIISWVFFPFFQSWLKSICQNPIKLVQEIELADETEAHKRQTLVARVQSGWTQNEFCYLYYSCYLFINYHLITWKKKLIQFWDFMMNGFEFSWSQGVWTQNEFEFSWQTVVPNKANFQVESMSRYSPYKYSFICNENWITQWMWNLFQK